MNDALFLRGFGVVRCRCCFRYPSRAKRLSASIGTCSLVVKYQKSRDETGVTDGEREIYMRLELWYFGAVRDARFTGFGPSYF